MGYEVIVFLVLAPFPGWDVPNHFEMYLKPITCGILQSCGMRHWVVMFVILVILRDWDWLMSVIWDGVVSLLK